jgi:hypothetical protein
MNKPRPSQNPICWTGKNQAAHICVARHITNVHYCSLLLQQTAGPNMQSPVRSISFSLDTKPDQGEYLNNCFVFARAEEGAGASVPLTCRGRTASLVLGEDKFPILHQSICRQIHIERKRRVQERARDMHLPSAAGGLGTLQLPAAWRRYSGRRRWEQQARGRWGRRASMGPWLVDGA